MRDALLIVGGWIAGYLSSSFVQRRGLDRTRSSDLHKLLTELKTANYANDRVKRAGDLRAFSTFLGDQISKSTEGVISLWQAMAEIEHSKPQGPQERQKADDEMAALSAQADAVLNDLLQMLKRKGR